MDSKTFKYAVLAFIVIIAIICLSGDLLSVTLIALITASFLLINNSLDVQNNITQEKLAQPNNTNDMPELDIKPGEIAATTSDVDAAPTNTYENIPTIMEGGWGYNPNYSRCYRKPPFEMNNCDIYERMDVDEYNSWIQRARYRDKKVSDGWVTKNANYFKRHYGDELTREENLRWWGNNEI